MNFPSREVVQRIRETYPVGCRVELIGMGPDPYSKLERGSQGIVNHVDDIGTVFVSWDCGSGLGMAYGEDHILRIDGKVGESIFVLNGQPVPAPAGWDGTISSLYAYINHALQIAQALTVPPAGQEPGSLTFTHVLKLSSAGLDTIYGYLNASTEDEFQGEDHTIIHTVRFPDGKEMDIKCCGCRSDPSWTEAVLFDIHGHQLACSEVCEDFLGPWELEYSGVTYSVNVVAADKGYVPPKTDQESICPVCGAELREYEAHEILDCGGVIPWKCSNCGATGEEGYTRIFSGHYQVCFANGDSVPGRE